MLQIVTEATQIRGNLDLQHQDRDRDRSYPIAERRDPAQPPPRRSAAPACRREGVTCAALRRAGVSTDPYPRQPELHRQRSHSPSRTIGPFQKSAV